MGKGVVLALILISATLALAGNKVYASSDPLQQYCYTSDVQYLDSTGSHSITDVMEQYVYLVNSYNAAVNAIKSANPSITLDSLHTHLAQGQGYQKMVALEDCFQLHGFNATSIAQMNPNLSQVVAVPEFGVLASLVILVSISGAIIISKKLQLLPLK